jgi:predicted Zn-dependent protease
MGGRFPSMRTSMLCLATFGAIVFAEPSRAAAQAPASDSTEIALGAALARQFDAERGIAPTEESARIERYLQGIADSLGRHTRRRLPWTIHYDPHPGIHSGFALPGGHIVIWGGVLAMMSTEDEAVAVIAHEIEHIDLGQVSGRIVSLAAEKHRSPQRPEEWKWDEFGESFGAVKENLCDYEGAKLAVQAGWSPTGFRTLLQSFVALARVQAPTKPAPQAIVVRIDQIEKEIRTEHWETLTRTRPLALPGSGE